MKRHMDIEPSHAFVAMLVTGTEGLIDRVPKVWQAIVVLGLAFMAGGVVTKTWSDQRDLPRRVSEIESRLDKRRALIDARLDTLKIRADYLEISTQHIESQNDRMLCRLDGESPNLCDLRYNNRTPSRRARTLERGDP